MILSRMRSILLSLAVACTACGGGAATDNMDQRAADMAASAVFPASMVSASYVLGSADGEPYYIKCSAQANKIILVLHTWSSTHAQVMSFPELDAVDRACIVAPNFNGPNNTPQALGSADAIQRIHIVLQEVQYKTQLSRVYVFTASGGTLAALNYMGTYPGRVHRASLWLPIHDLALLHAGTSDASLKSDMEAAIGSAPTGPTDSRYLERSPASKIGQSAGPMTVFLNIGQSDTVTPPIHGQRARDQLQGRPGVTAVYKEWPIAHEFGPAQRTEAIKQLILE